MNYYRKKLKENYKLQEDIKDEEDDEESFLEVFNNFLLREANDFYSEEGFTEINYTVDYGDKTYKICISEK